MTEQDVLKRIGANITRIRKHRGFTVAELAAKVDMEKSNLIPITKGRINTTIGTLVKLANALKVEPSEFFIK